MNYIRDSTPNIDHSHAKTQASDRHPHCEHEHDHAGTPTGACENADDRQPAGYADDDAGSSTFNAD
jgi:ABC-type nickel/cobalt efflux system permease component RcnA